MCSFFPSFIHVFLPLPTRSFFRVSMHEFLLPCTRCIFSSFLHPSFLYPLNRAFLPSGYNDSFLLPQILVSLTIQYVFESNNSRRLHLTLFFLFFFLTLLDSSVQARCHNGRSERCSLAVSAAVRRRGDTARGT